MVVIDALRSPHFWASPPWLMSPERVGNLKRLGAGYLLKVAIFRFSGTSCGSWFAMLGLLPSSTEEGRFRKAGDGWGWGAGRETRAFSPSWKTPLLQRSLMHGIG